MSSLPHNAQVGELYRGHHSWLRGWLFKRLECHHQAADLAQDTFLRLLGRDTLNGLREPRAFLATVAKGLVVDHYRRLSLERAWLDSLAALPDPEAPSAEARVLVLETLVEIDRMLDGLKPKVRSAFLLSQLDGLTYPQIAEQLGISLSSVQQYMTQAFGHCYRVLYS
ncbi:MULTISPECIES: sigma-70 family RNA polymerase sigma factor [unclassified Pseudomonas]|uniref:sigma-70 family RNA polymerase sigma factor n=1 Tax=Pseudomonas TaxID=286 RepID=UPI000D012F26|nr:MULTISPECIES: sigma-70 family RNA polymerase sigma factor [unclassified Pseudomonas]PRN06759.1 RNA polymerase subunit sigma [Pseudomonas sp. LLC-1]PYG82142.1 RNA polymerase sigma-70 factor (ECF subfamily) [Pseudomonas sp. RV120224-01c]PYG85500.1 RNA polymerase sigma-70 factor (ECF subfamily) [Pseudomonas sp. RV120224-01b]